MAFILRARAVEGVEAAAGLASGDRVLEGSAGSKSFSRVEGRGKRMASPLDTGV